MTENRIPMAFQNGKAFIGFVVGGDPSLEASEEFCVALAQGGCDLIEIGIPFSDPIAEGPAIQNANIRALSGGATVDSMFSLAERVRKRAGVPIAFLTYLNPVFRRGYRSFFSDAKSAGADGAIIPDLPFEEQGEAKADAQEAGVSLISMVSPTSKERIASIARDASGFLYVVSSMGVTGERKEFSSSLEGMMALARQSARIPACIGFGISTPSQAASLAAISDGVIVGSAIVRIAAEYGKGASPHLERYARQMKDAVMGAAERA
jgi:tryptophan synthase alpha chain